MSASMGVTAQLGLGVASPVTEMYEFMKDSVMLKETISDLSGIRGTRSRPKERSKITKREVGGQLVMQPTPAELALLLPRILGAAAVGTTFALAETLPVFFQTSDRVTKVVTYNGCVVNKATFKAAVGGPLELTLDIIGKDETVANAGTFPALTLDETAEPFILAELALVIGGTTYKCDQWESVIDNALEVRFGNSLIATEINPTDRNVTMSTRVPYADAGTLYGSGSTGLAVTATFTNGGSATSILFSYAALEFPKETPVVDGRGEIWTPINGVSRMSGATRELVITLDSTP